MDIRVVHTLAPEILELLKSLNIASSNGNGNGQPPTATQIETPKKSPRKALVAVKEAVVEEAGEVDDFEEVTGEKVSLEKIREVVNVKAQGGKREAVKKLLADYSVKKITDLEESQYSEFFTDLNAL